MSNNAGGGINIEGNGPLTIENSTLSGNSAYGAIYDYAAPATVSNAVTIHVASSHPGLPTCLVISADTMKIPDPIIEPITIIVESANPRPRWNSVSGAVASALDISLGYAGEVHGEF